MDAEVREMFELVLTEIRGTKEEVGGLKQEFADLKQEVCVLKEDVHLLKQDVSDLKQDVSDLKEDVRDIKADLYDLNKRVSILEEKEELHFRMLERDLGAAIDGMLWLKEHKVDKAALRKATM